MSLESCMWSFGLCSQCLAFDSRQQLPVEPGGLVLGKALTNSVVLASDLIFGPQCLHSEAFIGSQVWWHMPTAQSLGRLQQENQWFKVILDLIKSWLKTKTLKLILLKKSSRCIDR